MFNMKPLIATIIAIVAIFLTGFKVGITIFKNNAKAYIVYDTIYLSSFGGEKLIIKADQTLRRMR